jgi:tetratricopeptide (TPR) repeat protein
MQCARNRLLTLSNAFPSPSLALLSSEMRKHKVLSRDGYLSAIWKTLQTGDPKTARELMDELKVRYQDESATTLYMKALLDSFDGNESNIMDTLERAHKLSPTLVLPLVALSRVHRNAGNVTQADDLVQKAIVAAQENLLNLDRLKGEAPRFWGTLPERYLHLGIALYEAGYRDRTMLVSSREALGAALALEPGLPSADVYFTSVLIDLHEEESALHYSNVRGAKSLYQAWLMLQRSRAHYYSDRTEEAQAELEQAREWHLPMEWQEWFETVILGGDSPSPRSSSSYFPFSANSVVPPQLIQFNRESPFSREKFSEFVAASFDSDRNVRHQAAFKVGTYFTKSSEDALHLFFSRFRSEVTEDYLSDVGWEGASFLLQFASELEPKEMARTRDLLLSDEMKKQTVALFMVTTHGAQCAQLLPSLKTYVQGASSRTPLSSLIKALGAINTLGSEGLLMELAKMKQFGTARGEIIEVLKYGSLPNSSIDSYLQSLIVTADFGKMTAIEKKAYLALSYRKLRRKMQKSINDTSTNELKRED